MTAAASICERDLGRDRRALARHPRLRRYQGANFASVRIRKRPARHKFFADRGTHLAAMVAYFALLSFVPLIFLALSLLGLVHRADASDFLIKELKRAFPRTSLKSILKLVHRVQDNAATLGIIGGVAPALVVALALQRARVGVQHRLRPAEPALPAREAGGRGPRDERPHDAVREPRRRRARRRAS